MSKIDIVTNKMALFMVCEAIGSDHELRKTIEPDENGLYDLTISVNGKEINAERFIEGLYESYKQAVKAAARDLLDNEYGKLLGEIHDICETLENHNKLFDEKVFGEVIHNHLIKEE